MTRTSSKWKSGGQSLRKFTVDFYVTGKVGEWDLTDPLCPYWRTAHFALWRVRTSDRLQLCLWWTSLFFPVTFLQAAVPVVGGCFPGHVPQCALTRLAQCCRAPVWATGQVSFKCNETFYLNLDTRKWCSTCSWMSVSRMPYSHVWLKINTHQVLVSVRAVWWSLG